MKRKKRNIERIMNPVEKEKYMLEIVLRETCDVLNEEGVV